MSLFKTNTCSVTLVAPFRQITLIPLLFSTDSRNRFSSIDGASSALWREPSSLSLLHSRFSPGRYLECSEQHFCTAQWKWKRGRSVIPSTQANRHQTNAMHFSSTNQCNNEGSDAVAFESRHESNETHSTREASDNNECPESESVSFVSME